MPGMPGTGVRFRTTIWNNRSFPGDVDLATLTEFDRLLVHALAGVLTNLLRQFHAAELRAAHRTKVRHFGTLRRQRFVVERARRHRIERQVDLVLPPDLEPRPRQGIVPGLGSRMALGEIRGVRGDFVRDHARLYVVTVREAEVLLRRHG